MARNVFLCYATPNFAAQRDMLCDNADAIGFDAVLTRGPSDLDPDFATAHTELLSAPRGGGYWLWKPQIILQELSKLSPGDLLVYSDAGRSAYYHFRRFPERLAARARTSGFLLGPVLAQYGPISHWTRRDAFLLTGMDRPDIHARPQILATWNFWSPTEETFRFLRLWRDTCTDPRCLSDQPNELGLDNLPGFRDHRHDQSILSLLAYRENAPYLDYRGRGAFSVLALRPESLIAHRFLKRIEDAEAMERGWMVPAMIRTFIDSRVERI